VDYLYFFVRNNVIKIGSILQISVHLQDVNYLTAYKTFGMSGYTTASGYIRHVLTKQGMYIVRACLVMAPDWKVLAVC
jgi:hypothetical protein